MPNVVSEDELLQFLSQVEEGAVRLTPESEPQAVFAGNVRYAASNGWKVVVFNDANQWDYIDSVETADGRKLDFDALDEMLKVRVYQPPGHIAWTKYGIPGYREFGCKTFPPKYRVHRATLDDLGSLLATIENLLRKTFRVARRQNIPHPPRLDDHAVSEQPGVEP